MKAVLVGTDFMYNQQRKIVPIEINTNVGWDNSNRVEQEVFDVAELVKYIKSKKIKEIYLEGQVSSILSNLRESLGTKYTVETKNLEEFNKIEDSETKLLIRTSYSDEAVVDSYCRDKYKTLKLIENDTFGHEYLCKVEGKVEGSIEALPNNGNYPNIIVKYRYPVYDKTDYPRLYKFDTVDEVRALIEVLEDGFFAMPYYYNESKLFENPEAIKMYRDWSIFVAENGNLTAIQVGDYTKICRPLDFAPIVYDGHKLDPECRGMFITPGSTVSSGEVLVEDTDLIYLGNGNWVSGSEIKVGDIVSSLEIPYHGSGSVKDHTFDYDIPYQELVESSSYVTASVSSVTPSYGFIDKVKLVFEDDTDWFDTGISSYLSIDPKDGSVRFAEIHNIKVGEEIILVKTDQLGNTKPVFERKTVKSVENVREYVRGYQLALTGPYIFLTREANNPSCYASIEHNAIRTLRVCMQGALPAYIDNNGQLMPKQGSTLYLSQNPISSTLYECGNSVAELLDSSTFDRCRKYTVGSTETILMSLEAYDYKSAESGDKTSTCCLDNNC